MSLIIKDIQYDNGLEELQSFDLSKQQFKLPKNGAMKMVVQDTDRHVEILLTIQTPLIHQQIRPMMEYERLQYDPEFARLEALCRGLKEKLMATEMELRKERDKQGIPVEAGKKDVLLLVPEEFQGSIEFALADAGLHAEEIETDVKRIVADLDDADPEDEVHEQVHLCHGHQFQEHDPVVMVDYGNEFQCPDCGNTKRKPR